MQLIVCARGALNGLMVAIVENRIRMDVINPARKPDAVASRQMCDIAENADWSAAIWQQCRSL